jgi:carbonic anhydrase
MYSALAQGVQKFRRSYYRRKRDNFSKLIRDGQSPHTLFITCADSRIVPEALTQSGPGDIFVLRNVGNMVPAYGSNHEVSSIGSAIEYAIDVLNVANIVVCGHSHCGACAALYNPQLEQSLPITSRWMEQGKNVKSIVLSNLVKADLRKNTLNTVFASHVRREEVLRATERAMVVQHLENLETYPAVINAVASGRLGLHGWYYIIESGEVEQFDRQQFAFVPVRHDFAPPAALRQVEKEQA